MRQHILVTGSRGVVGQKLVAELSARGHRVFGIDLMHHAGERGWAQDMSAEPWTYARCDIGEFRELERILQAAGPFDLVYNCAAEFGRWNGEDYYEQLWRSNAVGMHNLLELQRHWGFRMVHFSSSEVYGDWTGVMSEDVMDTDEIKQLNDYAMSKWVNEMQIRNAATLYGGEVVRVRLFNTYGPGEWYHPYRSVVCKFVYHALHGLPVKVFRGHHRSSTYVDDCVRTCANIADRFNAGRVYNIGSSQYHDIETIASLIWAEAGADPALLQSCESEKLTTKIKRVDNTRAVNELGHRETVTLAEGVRNTVEWMRGEYRL
jgi:dTDP-glucose 4,6-dehydratase